MTMRNTETLATTPTPGSSYVPMVADVLLAMRELGVDQDTAVIALGGIP